MFNFKEIAEKCLLGIEEGVFVTRSGKLLSSLLLVKTKNCAKIETNLPKTIIKKFPYSFIRQYQHINNDIYPAIDAYTNAGNYNIIDKKAAKTPLDIISFIPTKTILKLCKNNKPCV